MDEMNRRKNNTWAVFQVPDKSAFKAEIIEFSANGITYWTDAAFLEKLKAVPAPENSITFMPWHQIRKIVDLGPQE